MRSVILRLLAVAFVTVTASSTARCESVDDEGQWNAFFSQGDLGSSSRLKWWFDGHLRLLDDAGGFNQSIVRPGIGWSLTDDLVVWGGYGWIHTSPLTGDNFNEHRIWQQFTWSGGNDDLKFALRPRLEQRFVEAGDDVGVRFRQLVRVHHPLRSKPRLTLIAWDEVFIHLNDTDWGAETGFDQNRLFLGFGWKQHPDCRLRTEIGYLNQTINTRAGPDRVNHILSINFFH